jgi:hypothetical protein
MSTTSTQLYAGEALCVAENKSSGDARPCGKKAYYTHSRSRSAFRLQLPKRPVPKFDLQKQLETSVAPSTSVGECVRLQRMRMMRKVEQLPGYVCVFPNYRHENRVDGYGLSSLSPMKLGPVLHGQPGLPAARKLESFWQMSKRFVTEVNDGLFLQAKVNGFMQTEPQRHKLKGVAMSYWSWVGQDGLERALDYITARQFYCHFYQHLAVATDAWMRLYKMVRMDHVRVQICGYDAHAMGQNTAQDIERAYLDPSQPFGHERVLVAMLLLPDSQLPWNKHWKKESDMPLSESAKARLEAQQ